MPLCVILSKKTPLRGCFRVELSKIHNKLRIFESQNAVSVLRIYKGGKISRPRSRLAALLRSSTPLRLCRSSAQDDMGGCAWRSTPRL